ncbi:MAG: hypothetical protein EPGJADBJ_02786 [Saprospiraceae bacterium]|nr:hypothetical protein [Saprospiraceae bacterium]
MILLFCCATLPAQEQTDAFFRDWSPEKYSFSEHRDPCKVFIGVGTTSVPGGLKVDYTVDNTPARASGVQEGDLILALDGIAVGTHSELVRERDKHRQGDAFTLTILRDGSEIKINARFKECSQEEQEQFRQQEEDIRMRIVEQMEHLKALRHPGDWQMKTPGSEGLMKIEKMERPILGVYENEEISVPGLVIGSVIAGKGAEAAGLKTGDVVTSVDGKTVTGGGTLRAALNDHRPGDHVTVVYQRDGQTYETELTLSADRGFSSFKMERDPCAVFIGVYTGENGSDGRGVRVTGIVDNTPAKQSGVQPDDIILALDDQRVNTNAELLIERNKHRSGDPFQLTIDRDGAILTIDAIFKSCPTPEVAEMQEAKTPAEPRKNDPVNVEASPFLERLELFPNPTTGPVNVRFEAEAVPTTVRILDASGRTVYSKSLPQFNGYFNEQINLFGNTPGTYLLTIQQGERVSNRKVVLVPGA